MITNILLRDVTENDLPVFFEHEQDPMANYMAAFTAKDPADRAAFEAHWSRIMGDPAILIKTILIDGLVAGHVASFEQSGDLEVTYWLGREYWGKGIATKALAAFLNHQKQRPVHARAAKDNFASIRVLEKCGFISIGFDRGFANARGEEIEEVVMVLR